jgi:hypothetical protein
LRASLLVVAPWGCGGRQVTLRFGRVSGVAVSIFVAAHSADPSPVDPSFSDQRSSSTGIEH